MPLSLAYVFAVVGAGCLFLTDGFLWPVPALLTGVTHREDAFPQDERFTAESASPPTVASDSFSTIACFSVRNSWLIVLAAYLTRAVRVASWTIAGSSGLLALWSAWVLHHALKPEGDRILFAGLTPLAQIAVLVAVLLPLLLSICGHHCLTRPNPALERTPTAGNANSAGDAHRPQ